MLLRTLHVTERSAWLMDESVQQNFPSCVSACSIPRYSDGVNNRNFRLLAVVTSLVTAVAGSAALPMQASATGPVVPLISNFAPSSATLLTAGGSITLTANLAAPATCSLKVSPAIAGLGSGPSCTGASLSEAVVVPANATASPIAYTFTLTSRNSAGSASATTTVTVAQVPTPTISNFVPSSPTVPDTGGSITLTATLATPATCSLKASPALSSLDTRPSCSNGRLSVQTVIPPNLTTHPINYTFSLKASNVAGKVSATSTVTANPAVAPTISNFAPSSPTVPNTGGSITLTATLAAPAACSLKASPAISGLDAQPDCSHGTLSLGVVIPPNTTTSPITYTFKLKAANVVGKKKATSTLTIDPTPPPRITDFAPSSPTLSPAGGQLTLTATVTGDPVCSLRASPAIPGLNTHPSCLGGSISIDVAIPVNTSTSPITYTFKLKATNVAAQAKARTTVSMGAYVAPAFSNLTSTPATLSVTGGDVHVAADVAGNPSCVIKISPTIIGSPLHPSCGEGSLDQIIAIPTNMTTSPITYTIKIKATNLVGKATATKTVTIDGGVAPAIGAFGTSAESVPAGGGPVTLTGTVTAATSCSMSVKPKLPILDPSPNCQAGPLSEHVDIPVNTTTSAISYVFTMTASNVYGAVASTTTVVLAQNTLPSITNYASTPGTLVWTGGRVHLQAQLANTSTCSISVSPSITGTPWTPTCVAGSLDQSVVIPTNLSSSKSATYTFTLSATSVVGTTTAKTTVVVSQKPVPSVTSFSSAPNPQNVLGGSVTLTASVVAADTCQITVSPSLVSAPFSPSCAGGSLSQLVQLPINTGAAGVTYTFTLRVSSAAGTSPASTIAVVVPAVFPGLSFLPPQTVLVEHGYPSSISCTPSFCALADLSGSVMIKTGPTWSAASAVDPNPLTGISCQSSTFCAAVDSAGGAVTFDGTSWSIPTQVSSNLTAVSCPSNTMCVATDQSGSVVWWNGTNWGTPQVISNYPLTSVSCALTSFCMAVDSSGRGYSWRGSTWSAGSLASSDLLTTVSCPSATECFAAGAPASAGVNVVVWNGSTWSPSGTLGRDTITSLSCSATTICVAGTDSGSVYRLSVGQWSTAQSLEVDGWIAQVSCPTDDSCTAASFSGSTYTWSSTSSSTWVSAPGIDAPAGYLVGISCATPTTCVALSSEGGAFAFTAGSWSSTSSTGLSSSSGISCSSPSFCMAVSLDGAAATFDGTQWVATSAVPSAPALDGVSCTSRMFCLAVSAGGELLSYDGTGWINLLTTSTDTSALNGVSCASTTFCSAISQSGIAWTWNGTTVSSKIVFASRVPGTSVNCPTPSMCVYGSRDGRVALWTASGGWQGSSKVSDQSVVSVSCLAGTVSCMALDATGRVSTSVGGKVWSASELAEGNGSALGLSCAVDATCTIIDGSSATRTGLGSPSRLR